jgi:hypothetical protein
MHEMAKTDLPEIHDEPGMAERFQRGLQRALNTPPKHRSSAKKREDAVAKEQKTATELETLIMGEIRQHPEWRDVDSVAIIQKVQHASHHPNWDAAFTMNGSATPPEEAFAIVRQLQSQFDLA